MISHGRAFKIMGMLLKHERKPAHRAVNEFVTGALHGQKYVDT